MNFKQIHQLITSAALLASFITISGGRCNEEARQVTPTNELHRAASLNDVNGIKIALAKGIDINTRDQVGNTAVHFAASYGNLDALKLLKERGANCEIRNLNHETPADQVRRSINRQHYQMRRCHHHRHDQFIMGDYRIQRHFPNCGGNMHRYHELLSALKS